jgi:hypothetical protein
MITMRSGRIDLDIQTFTERRSAMAQQAFCSW